MQTRIKTTNFDLTEALTVLVKDKLTFPAEKLLENIDGQADIILDVELGKTTQHHRDGRIWKCEANLSVPYQKHIIRAEYTAESMEAAVDEVKDELEREIKKYKDKRKDEVRRGARAAKEYRSDAD